MPRRRRGHKKRKKIFCLYVTSLTIRWGRWGDCGGGVSGFRSGHLDISSSLPSSMWVSAWHQWSDEWQLISSSTQHVIEKLRETGSYTRGECGTGQQLCVRVGLLTWFSHLIIYPSYHSGRVRENHRIKSIISELRLSYYEGYFCVIWDAFYT